MNKDIIKRYSNGEIAERAECTCARGGFEAFVQKGTFSTLGTNLLAPQAP